MSTESSSRKDEEKQSWAEAVIECVSDSAERERLIRLYDYDELVKACLALGTLALSAKHESARNKQLEAALSEIASPDALYTALARKVTASQWQNEHYNQGLWDMKEALKGKEK